MENLLNAEVIKAAASSPMGILSLMCLVLGVIVLALFKGASARIKVFVFVLLLFGVAGFGYTVLNQHSPSATPEATRQFVIGYWQVEQKIPNAEGGSSIDYLEDGTFSGTQEIFTNGRGRRGQVKGSWNFMRLGKDQFRMALNFDNGTRWQGTFKILDNNRIYNIDENYVSVRVPR